MWLNNIKTAWRNLQRKKAFGVINIIGLSISLAGVLLIYRYVNHEVSYDQFHAKADRIYRVYCDYATQDSEMKFPNTPPIFIPALMEELPEIEKAVRLYDVPGSVVIGYNEEVVNQTGLYIADSSFFDVFTTSFLAGDPASALTKPNSIVLTSTTATKYFGNISEALGKTLDITMDNEQPYQVTGVVEDFPSNSHLQFNALLSVDYAKENNDPQNWLAHFPLSYLVVPEGMDAASIEDKIIKMTERILDPIYEQRFGKSYQEHKAAGGLQEYRLQALTDIRLFSGDIGGNQQSQGNILYVYLFSGIGLLLIGIASFNYINLTTAQSAREARSAGVRKVFGASKSQLYRLVLTESVGMVLIAALLSVIAVQALLALNLSFLNLFIPNLPVSLEEGMVMLVIALALGLFSGFVPAKIMGTFQPAKVLKGELVQGQKGGRLRQVLVIGQFTVSAGLIICTFLISQQLNYLQTRSLGFDKEHLIIVKNVDKLGDKKATLKQSLANKNFVVNASLSYNDLGDPFNFAAFTPVELIDAGIQEALGIPVYIGDSDYLETLDVELVMGHPFPVDLAKEHQQIILNETALRSVGWQDRKEEDVVGKIIDVNGQKYELAGIVKDYNFQSLREKIGPMAIFSHYYLEYESLLLRIKSGSEQQAIQSLQAEWEQLAPHVPFDFSFLDEDLDKLYKSEQNLGALFRIFAGLTIFVACLGLLGLAMFTAGQRVKEIGVRKVMGASVFSIVSLLSIDFIRLVGIAFLIAAPIAWYAMDQWLQGFTYRIPIGWDVFVITGLMTVAIALITISFQSIKAAQVNPVKSLKSE